MPGNSIDRLRFSNAFIRLGPEFYQLKAPDPVPSPTLIHFNPGAAPLIGLDPTEGTKEEFVLTFAGNRALPGAEPLAMAYSGHQFGVYNPRLGDGRGLLLGEVTGEEGKGWGLHLKGSGPTRFARGFDGRATLRSSIREYLGSEALAGLGIPTTRALALIGTGEVVWRETPAPGAILVRLADTHIRFGSFEYFHHTRQPGNVRRLADHAIAMHHPELEGDAGRYRLFFRQVLEKTARLIARWQAFGFIHGVMNTDNMSITGATFDYGPFGFLDAFQPRFTANHTDTAGRYAFGRQPETGFWNLEKLAIALSSLPGAEDLAEELGRYQPLYNRCFRELVGQKLGLAILDADFTRLAGNLFQLLHENPVDYTNFFRRLADFPHRGVDALRDNFLKPQALDAWLADYQRLLDREDESDEIRRKMMNRINPRFIPRNYLLDRAVEAALKHSDYAEIARLIHVFEDPFNEEAEILARQGIDPAFYAADTPADRREMRLSCSA